MGVSRSLTFTREKIGHLELELCPLSFEVAILPTKRRKMLGKVTRWMGPARRFMILWSEGSSGEMPLRAPSYQKWAEGAK